MPDCLLRDKPSNSIPLVLIPEGKLDPWLGRQEDHLRRWIESSGFTAKPGRVCLVPGPEGELKGVVVGIKSSEDPWACGALPTHLPAGNYHLDGDWEIAERERLSLGWGLGGYRFTRYVSTDKPLAKLVVDSECDIDAIRQQVRAVGLVRDLINTPAGDMMPEHLAETLESLAAEFDAGFGQIVGEALLEQNFPAIHAVGRASDHPPRLLELCWGDENHPKLTLVGKGVCFDSGGLDLKPANAMRTMKKDMGGAAQVIGLARLIMAAGLPVRLRVLVPAVENAVAGNAFRPGDVLNSRQGLTIEIENTDAEGRLILCDALAEGASEKPELMIDFATLTGAARVALGAEVAVLFTNSDAVAAGLAEASGRTMDPLWRLPLHQPYRELLDSKVANIANCSSGPFAGAITAALFLQEFVPGSVEWAHFDVMAWNPRSRPGRPEGGEAMGIRATFDYLKQRFGER